MAKSFIAEWIESIRPLFPKGAKIEIDKGVNLDEESDVILRIFWKLNNDPERPNKISRIIRVIISGESIHDCQDFKKAGLKFKKIITNKLSVFNPEHNALRNNESPVEEWIISTFELN